MKNIVILTFQGCRFMRDSWWMSWVNSHSRIPSWIYWRKTTAVQT